jgi:hypothetical protein
VHGVLHFVHEGHGRGWGDARERRGEADVSRVPDEACLLGRGDRGEVRRTGASGRHAWPEPARTRCWGRSARRTDAAVRGAL